MLLRRFSFLEDMGWLGLREVMGYPCALLLQMSLRRYVRLLAAYVVTTQSIRIDLKGMHIMQVSCTCAYISLLNKTKTE